MAAMPLLAAGAIALVCTEVPAIGMLGGAGALLGFGSQWIMDFLQDLYDRIFVKMPKKLMKETRELIMLALGSVGLDGMLAPAMHFLESTVHGLTDWLQKVGERGKAAVMLLAAYLLLMRR